MIKYQTLDNIPLEVIYQTFMDVFSDYQVTFNLSYEDFLITLMKKGYDSHFSIGAFYNKKLIGFILNGVRMWNYQLTIYDIGTGVIPQMRKHGITSQMFNKIKQIIKQTNIKQYLLEVIQTNEKAYNFYQKEGFQVQRLFKCYQIKKKQFNFIQNHEVKHVNYHDVNNLQDFWNCQPSWQNSNASLSAIKEQYFYSVVYDQNRIVGYGIIDKMSGDIGQMAVDPQYRNQGIGRSILIDLIKRTDASSIKILNVEDSITQQFLTHLGFINYVDQYEMILNL